MPSATTGNGSDHTPTNTNTINDTQQDAHHGRQVQIRLQIQAAIPAEPVPSASPSPPLAIHLHEWPEEIAGRLYQRNALQSLRENHFDLQSGHSPKQSPLSNQLLPASASAREDSRSVNSPSSHRSSSIFTFHTESGGCGLTASSELNAKVDALLKDGAGKEESEESPASTAPRRGPTIEEEQHYQHEPLRCVTLVPLKRSPAIHALQLPDILPTDLSILSTVRSLNESARTHADTERDPPSELPTHRDDADLVHDTAAGESVTAENTPKSGIMPLLSVTFAEHVAQLALAATDVSHSQSARTHAHVHSSQNGSQLNSTDEQQCWVGVPRLRLGASLSFSASCSSSCSPSPAQQQTAVRSSDSFSRRAMVPVPAGITPNGLSSSSGSVSASCSPAMVTSALPRSGSSSATCTPRQSLSSTSSLWMRRQSPKVQFTSQSVL